MTFNKTPSSAMWSKIFGNIGYMQEPAVGGTLWKGMGLPAMFKMIQRRKKRYSESKTSMRARISSGAGNQWEATTGTSTIWKFFLKMYSSRLLAGPGMKAWNMVCLFVSNQIKLTTKTRDIWPIPPEWKWLNIRRKERKKRECREGKRSPITKFCLTSV